MKKLVIGCFNSEKYWHDDCMTVLPSINDSSSQNIISVMDELLFPFCDENGVLLTGIKMNDAHKDYLNKIGFKFASNNESLYDKIEDAGLSGSNIFQIIGEKKNDSNIKELFHSGMNIYPYAIIKGIKEMCDSFMVSYALPDELCVKKVNSKIYSHTLNNKLGLNRHGNIIYSADQLMEQGKFLLNNGWFLIKDEYGVSGKGNILVSSERMLNRICRYIRKQEDSGMHTRFIIESYLNKFLDFSCDIYVDSSGEVDIVSVQILKNDGFNYAGSYKADDEFIEMVGVKDYFSVAKAVGRELYAEGYFGDVCIDSMILQDGQVIPIVEINARKSMGMINYKVDKYLEQFGLLGQLMLYSVGYVKPMEFCTLLEKMRKENILFLPEKNKGIIPLSANALFVNSMSSAHDNENMMEDIFKGRFYYSAAADTKVQRAELAEKMAEILLSSGYKIF